MSREVLSKALDPFFTTKEIGRGTGLGLSMAYGFVKQSGGHLKIYSEEGHGTTVKIYLPRLLGVDEVVDERESAPVDRIKRDRSILVVEDDDDVRAYTVEILRELGYRVLEAHDGPSALRLIERQDRLIDLMFTDVVMPGMSGRELADRARAVQPELKVLYTSGYTRNAIVHGGRLDAGRRGDRQAVHLPGARREGCRRPRSGSDRPNSFGRGKCKRQDVRRPGASRRSGIRWIKLPLDLRHWGAPARHKAVMTQC